MIAKGSLIQTMAEARFGILFVASSLIGSSVIHLITKQNVQILHRRPTYFKVVRATGVLADRRSDAIFAPRFRPQFNLCKWKELEEIVCGAECHLTDSMIK